MQSRSNQVIKRSSLHQSTEQAWPRACHTNSAETKSGAAISGKAAQTAAHFKGRDLLSAVIIRRHPLETQRSTKASGEKPLRTYHQQSVRSEVGCLKKIKEKERNRFLVLGRFSDFPGVKGVNWVATKKRRDRAWRFHLTHSNAMTGSYRNPAELIDTSTFQR